MAEETKNQEHKFSAEIADKYNVTGLTPTKVQFGPKFGMQHMDLRTATAEQVDKFCAKYDGKDGRAQQPYFTPKNKTAASGAGAAAGAGK